MSGSDISQIENGIEFIELGGSEAVELRHHNEDAQRWHSLFESLSQPGDKTIDITELEDHITNSSSREVTNSNAFITFKYCAPIEPIRFELSSL